MAFLRFSRDNRGYEHFYLVEPTTNRRGKSRQRVLYWFRTPPNVKIGREPFDDDVRRALEAQNPTVAFDWRKILETPIPSADVEKWRERRRVERAARHAARGEAPMEAERAAPDVPDEAAAEPGDSAAEVVESIPTVVESAAAATQAPSVVERARRRRRRRRGGRGIRPAGTFPATTDSPTAITDSPSVDVETAPDAHDVEPPRSDAAMDEPAGE